MIYGFNKDYIGKHVWAFIPQKDGSLSEKHGIITSFFNSELDQYYMVQYEGFPTTSLAAAPEWLIFEPKNE